MLSDDIHDAWKVVTDLISRMPREEPSAEGATDAGAALWCAQQAQRWLERAKANQLDAEGGRMPTPHVAARPWRRTT